METETKMTQRDRRMAAMAQALYLTNISILPAFSFLILIVLYIQNWDLVGATARLHFRQAILASIIAGFLLCVVSSVILLTGSFYSPYTWMILLIYFISIHSALILFGVFALIKALAEQRYIYPVFGKWWQ